jgi:hypothetical protein
MKANSICLTLSALALTACGLDVRLDTHPEQVAEAADAIATFDPPPGFQAELSGGVDAITLVSYTNGDGYSHLYLVQSTDPADAETLTRALADLRPGEFDPEHRLQVIESRPVTVRGDTCSLVVSEGENGEGQCYRQALVPFAGNGGPALLVFSTVCQAWDDETVTTVIASLR